MACAGEADIETPSDPMAERPDAVDSASGLPAAVWVPAVIVILGLLMWVFAG